MEHVKSYDRVIFPFPRKETVYCPLLYEIISKFRYEILKWISQGIIKNKCPYFVRMIKFEFITYMYMVTIFMLISPVSHAA
jgi:hypothetical protein